MTARRQVWGVAFMALTQKVAVKAHCFGDCGKISMAGAVMDDHAGGLFVCCQETCPYQQEEIRGYGETLSFGKPHTLHLRILREEKPSAEIRQSGESIAMILNDRSSSIRIRKQGNVA